MEVSCYERQPLSAQGLQRRLPNQGQLWTHAFVGRRLVIYCLRCVCINYVSRAFFIVRTMKIRVEMHVFGELHVRVYTSFSTKSL